MSAKLIYNTLADKKAELHKQISCMNGFFQIFDRHHFLTGRPVKGQKMLPPVPGQSGNQGVELSSASEKSTERSVKVTQDKHRVSTESSRTSFSSSSCSSSFSSLECNRITQLDTSSYGQNNSSRDFLETQPKPQAPDLRDFVESSVYREAHALSVKTVAKEETQGHMFKHIDSPRPSQQTKSVPWNSKEEKDRSRLLSTRDAPRFSFDGRGSCDTFKSLKIKDLPGLSLDSRENTNRVTTREMKSNYFVRDQQMENMNSGTIPTQPQEMRCHNRASSVVAKLMGLETFPAETESIKNQTSFFKACPGEDDSKQNHIPQNSYIPTQMRMRNADSVTKSASSSKLPTEPAPWKQTEERRVPGLNLQEADTDSSNSSASVYCEIEKRLADIKFKKSGKDLSALKRVLEAMQKTRKDNLACQTGSIEQSPKLSNQRNLQNSKSTIVIMKPTTLTDRANSISDEKTFTNSRKGSVGKYPTKDLTDKGNTSSCSLHSIGLNTRSRTPISVRTSKAATQVIRESTSSSGKSSGTVSPRLQQKRNGLEKKSCTTTPSSDLSRNGRQLSRQPIESGSLGRKLKPRHPNSQHDNNQSKRTSSSMIGLINHGEAIPQQSENSTSSVSHIELETDATSTSGSDKNNIIFLEHYGQKQKSLDVKFMANRDVAKPTVVTLEQPSHISVLDSTLYRDESTSPLKKIATPFKDDEALNSDEARWALVGINHQLQTRISNLSSKSNHKNTEIIEHRVSIDGLDEAIINDITVPCEQSNQDHRYISTIVLASGLLRNLNCGMSTVPCHSSGHPINPSMFDAVEQTMANIRISNDDRRSRNTPNKKAVEKIQRKLIFDVVNEILRHKLVLESCSKQWFSPNKPAGGKFKCKQLMAELLFEIDTLQRNNAGCLSDDGLARISWGDMMHQSVNWFYTSENAELVLGIERLIFKDLISEVVKSETANLQTRSGGCCRQMFC